MNRSARFVPLVVAAVMTFAFLAKPQPVEAGNWNWKKFRLKMWLPTGMKPTKNNRNSFIAKGMGIVLKIKPWKSRSMTSKKAALYGYNSYSIVKRKRIVFEKRMGKRGAFTYILMGQGIAQGRPAYFAVIGLSSKLSINNFYARMWWRPARHRWVKKRVIKIAKRLRVY